MAHDPPPLLPLTLASSTLAYRVTPSRARVPRTLTPVGRVSHPPSPSRSFPPRSPRARRRRPRTRSTSVVCSHPRVSPRASRDTARDTRASRSTPWRDRRRVTGRPAGRRGDDGDGGDCLSSRDSWYAHAPKWGAGREAHVSSYRALETSMCRAFHDDVCIGMGDGWLH